MNYLHRKWSPQLSIFSSLTSIRNFVKCPEIGDLMVYVILKFIFDDHFSVDVHEAARKGNISDLRSLFDKSGVFGLNAVVFCV